MPINPFKDNKLIELEKKVISKLQTKEYKDLKDIEKICAEGILMAESANEKADVDFFKGVLNYCADNKKDMYLFCWDDVPENNTEFIKFLKDELKIEWTNYYPLFKDSRNNSENAAIKKTSNNKAITVIYGNNSLLFNKEKDNVILDTGGKIYKYTLKEERGKIKVYKTAAISKENNKTISVINGNKNSLVLKLNKTKKTVTLKTDNNKFYEYILKEENNKINIYKQKKDAVEFLKEAIKKEENFLFAHYVLGFIYNESNDYNAAKEEWTKCIEIDKNFADAYFDLGVVLKNIGNFAEAIEHFKKALEFYEKTNYTKAIEVNWWIQNINNLKAQQTERSAEENVIEVIVEDLRDRKERLFQYINEKEGKFKNFVSAKKTITNTENFIVVLRRWNSYTPALSSDIERRKGGGYFLSWNGTGFVIDPGFNFIENFFANGFNISDIDAIFISHSHLDHTSDFESLMTLLFERNDNLPQEEKKKIDLFLNFSSMNKFANLLSLDKSAVRNIYVLQPGIPVDMSEKYGFVLTPTKAKHRELWGDEYSVGLIFDFIENIKKKFRLGMTIDTGYTNEIGAQFKNSDILIAHIGSIKEKEFDLNLNLNERLYKNHLGLIGTTKIIKDASPKLAVISEFGEELGSLRVDISKAIEGVVKDRRTKRCIPGDIGMKISLPELKIRCDMCSKEKGSDVFVDMNEINAIYFPEEVPGDPGKLTYVCKKHF